VEAPFTRIGPGQLVRLAYQVIGTNGPVPNPSKIRFMPFDSAEAVGFGLPMPGSPVLPMPDASAVMGAVQLANLGVGVLTLALSAAILVETKKQTRLLREMQVNLREVRADVKDLLTMAERIDLNVAEINLRETLTYALKSAAHRDEVDLVLLANLVDEALERFFESVGGCLRPGMKPELTLSSDVRQMAETVMHMLRAARLSAVEAHNLACGGAPHSVVRDEEVRLQLEALADSAAVIATVQRAHAVADKVADGLRDTRFYIGRTDGIRQSMHRDITEIEEQLDQFLSPTGTRHLLDTLAAKDSWQEAVGQGGTAMAAFLREYLRAWTAHTDAGLLWSLAHEVSLQKSETYWKALEGWMQPLLAARGETTVGVTRGVAAPA
jgi:hypothetical protein